jgi:hypothetical protein
VQWFLRRERGALAIRRGDQAPAADQADDPAADVGAAAVAGGRSFAWVEAQAANSKDF